MLIASPSLPSAAVELRSPSSQPVLGSDGEPEEVEPKLFLLLSSTDFHAQNTTLINGLTEYCDERIAEIIEDIEQRLQQFIVDFTTGYYADKKVSQA